MSSTSIRYCEVHCTRYMLLYKVALTSSLWKCCQGMIESLFNHGQFISCYRKLIDYCFHLTQRGTKVKRGLVHVSTLNPKCVTVGELYGEVNPTTMEWMDGLLPQIYRKYAKTSRGTIQGARRKQSTTPAPASPIRLSRSSSAKSIVTSGSALSLEDSNERETLYGFICFVMN